MTRLLRNALSIVTISTMIALFLPAKTGATQTGVTPFVDCVSFNQSSNELSINWGYINTGDDVFIEIGDSNFVSPAPADRDQTTFFENGVVHDAWTSTILLSQTSSLTWTVDGNAAVASNDPTLYCASCMCPAGPIGPTGSQGIPGVQGVQGAQGQIGPQGMVGDRGATGPQGLTGPPGPTGATGPQGPQGLVGPQGAPGSNNTFPSAQTYLFPGSGVITISDPNVLATSMVLVQYVGETGVGGAATVVTDVENGKFTVTGTYGRKFRYVVFN